MITVGNVSEGHRADTDGRRADVSVAGSRDHNFKLFDWRTSTLHKRRPSSRHRESFGKLLKDGLDRLVRDQRDKFGHRRYLHHSWLKFVSMKFIVKLILIHLFIKQTD